MQMLAEIEMRWGEGGGGMKGWLLNHQPLGVFADHTQRSESNLAVTSQQSCEFVSVVLFYLRPYDSIPVSN